MHLETYRLSPADLSLDADVLVLGGGPAATWAALTAARSGARVVLADKGYCGTSGATAAANTGAWYIPSGAKREAEAERRFSRGQNLADKRWVLRVIDEAKLGLDALGEEGYPFPTDEDGQPYRANLRGPDYMRFQRRRLERARVRILDHSPALELLWGDGRVVGASGQVLRTGERWQVRAGAVVLATGGCCFLSHALGTDGDTGDGYLMAAEAGARLSGMEFTGQYGVSAAFSSVTKGLAFMFASFYFEDGSPLPETGEDRQTRIARAIIEGREVYALFDRGEPAQHDILRRGQPNCFLPFDRVRLDPFKERFPVVLRSEGTTRGVGGIELAGDDCATGVAGLYAAGDAASRENIAGAVSGGGSPNASFAIASGVWSGRAAAQFALANPPPDRMEGLGGAGLRPAGRGAAPDIRDVVRTVQGETLPLDVNFFRRGLRMELSRVRLQSLWNDVRDRLVGVGRQAVRAREAAAMTATARFIWAAAAARTETRGIHRRTDYPDLDPTLTRRIAVDGLDGVRAQFQSPEWRAFAS